MAKLSNKLQIKFRNDRIAFLKAVRNDLESYTTALYCAYANAKKNKRAIRTEYLAGLILGQQLHYAITMMENTSGQR